MFRKEVIDTDGYLNEKFFMYYEETAWCWEIKEKGFELSILKDSVVYHKASDNGDLYFEGNVIQSGLPTWGDNDIIDIAIKRDF